MTKHEQVYALFVEANPYPDVEMLPETFEEARVPLRAVELSGRSEPDEHPTPVGSSAELPIRYRRRRSLVAIAAAIVMIVGLGVLLVRSQETSISPATGDTDLGLAHIEQAVEFISRLDARDIDAAEALLADPIGTIWFIPVGRVSDANQVRDYLEFYVAIGIETEISGCVGQMVGLLTEVVCEATQTTGALSRLGLELPPFDMTFSVRDDGIQQIGWAFEDPQRFDSAFARSRFYEFRGAVLRPLDLVQDNGDPIWSKENGARMQGLIDDFIALNP